MKTSFNLSLGLSFVLLFGLSACSGVRHSGKTFSVHAESIKILGYSIPGDDQARANELVPEGAKIETVTVSPADWTSVLGFIGNFLWIAQTNITGTVAKEEK
jgi:hypothetical protein